MRKVSPEDVAQYTRIIDHILKTSDLATVSRKKVRKGLETEIGKDLSDQKVCNPRPSSSHMGNLL